MRLTIRPIRPGDDRFVAAIIRTVMPEFGAGGPGFAINDPRSTT
jgi:putative acetyltransferase